MDKNNVILYDEHKKKVIAIGDNEAMEREYHILIEYIESNHLPTILTKINLKEFFKNYKMNDFVEYYILQDIQYKSHLFNILYESLNKGINQEEFSRILEEYLWSVPM